MSDTAPGAWPQAAPSMNETPEGVAATEKIAAIRAEIDGVDRAMLELVARRLSLADGLGALKVEEGAALPVRPAREVQMLRKLMAAAPEIVEPDLIIELWRSLIAANVRRQALVDVVIAGGTDQVRLHDIARRHFGARTRIHRLAEPQAALIKAAETPNMVAVLPWPAATGVGGWWPALSESRFHKLNLIAGLPMFAPGKDDPEACVFAAAPAEPAGEDATLLMAFDPHHRAQKALADAGLAGREVGRSEPRVLIRVEGFLAPNDPRVAIMSRHGLDGARVLGSYARV